MANFSIQSAAQFAFDINAMLNILPIQLQPLNTPDLWNVVIKYVAPRTFQSFLYSKCPRTREQFLSAIDNGARIFEQQSTLSNNSDDSLMHRRPPTDFRSTPHDSPFRSKINLVEKGAHLYEII